MGYLPLCPPHPFPLLIPPRVLTLGLTGPGTGSWWPLRGGSASATLGRSQESLLTGPGTPGLEMPSRSPRACPGLRSASAQQPEPLHASPCPEKGTWSGTPPRAGPGDCPAYSPPCRSPLATAVPIGNPPSLHVGVTTSPQRVGRWGALGAPSNLHRHLPSHGPCRGAPVCGLPARPSTPQAIWRDATGPGLPTEDTNPKVTSAASVLTSAGPSGALVSRPF